VSAGVLPVRHDGDGRRQLGPRLHRRQFVLGPEPFLEGEGWIAEEVRPSLYLSRCPELPVAAVADDRGIPSRLLGIAVQSDPERPLPAEELASAGSERPLEAYGSWCGRWILLRDWDLHLDAGGTLGCFYRTINRGRAGEVWASSSPVLLGALPDRPPPSRVAPSLTFGKGMEWYPPPCSRFGGINRLLPTQILSLRAAGVDRVRARPALVEGLRATAYEETLASLERTLVTSIANIGRYGAPAWLPLTAGVDSRLILAAAARAGVALTAFTQDYPSMAEGDRDLPPLLARELGYEHRLLRPGRLVRGKGTLFDAHTGGHCVDGNRGDRRFFAHGQWEMIPAPAVILRGGVFEIGRGYFYRKFPEPETGDLFELLAERFGFDEFHPNSFAHVAGVAEWVKWLTQAPHPGLDWRDRLYLEQRIAGWVSSIEQALDLTAYDRAYVANSHLYMATVLTLPEAVRASGQHHVDLIARMAPSLLGFPFNPRDEQSSWSRRLGDEWYEFRSRRWKRRYAASVVRRGARRARRALARIRREVPTSVRAHTE